MNKQNKNYWEDGDFYNTYVNGELSDSRKNAWKQQILKHFIPGKELTVLDVGCGPGFFSCILSEEGHNVYAVDRSAGMLEHAKANAKSLGVSPQFHHMDINKLSFKDNFFDLVVSRNVTWTLDDPKAVYVGFHRVLKPGGTLLIYDANWHLPFYDKDLMAWVRQNEQQYYNRFQQVFKIYDDDTTIFEGLPLSDTDRPAWDTALLKDLNFSSVNTEDDIGEQVYEDWERNLYSATPLFEIYAQKGLL